MRGCLKRRRKNTVEILNVFLMRPMILAFPGSNLHWRVPNTSLLRIEELGFQHASSIHD